MLQKIISFIDERRKDNKDKFADENYFWEFLFRDLHKEFGITHNLPKKTISKSLQIKLGKERNEKNAKAFLKKEKKEQDKKANCVGTTTCNVVEAMKILGTNKRWDIDIPISKGKIKKVGKIGVSVVLDRQSVIDYKNSLEDGKQQLKPKPISYGKYKTTTVKKPMNEKVTINGPGLEQEIEIQVNDPNKIMDDEMDDDEEY